jgi:broad specificity phosphatase PhoE
MDLILWRHAEAEPGEPDLGRRLTAKGIQQAERMAEWLDRNLPATTRILSSPADRAQQTAQALKRKFKVVDDHVPGASVPAVLAAAGWPAAWLERTQRSRVVAFQSGPRWRGDHGGEGRHRTRLRLTRRHGARAFMPGASVPCGPGPSSVRR